MLSKDVITGALRFLINIQNVSLKVENPEYICAERQFAVSHTPPSIFTRRNIKLEPDECSPRSFCIAFNFCCFRGNITVYDHFCRHSSQRGLTTEKECRESCSTF